MFKRAIGIALALIGLIVGAGFASGQEMLQYFVAFGTNGLWGVALAAIIMIIGSIAMMQLSSHLQAREHTMVFDRVTHPIVARFLDVATLVTLFGIGFVMFAGGGANFNQQFGWAPWVGTTLMMLLVMAVGMLDVDKVSAVIGAVTPFIILMIVGTAAYTLATADFDLSGLGAVASAEVTSSLPNWWLSAFNYVGLSLIVAVSMAMVIGGNNLDSRAAGIGGLLGGLCFALLLAAATLTIFLRVDDVAHDDMPMLSVVTDIHPALGIVMTFTIFMMIFNTALGLFYALAKRLTRNNPSRFRVVYIASVLVGFVLGFLPFKELVAYVYPVLGYAGIILALTLSIAWLRGRATIRKEYRRRNRIRELLTRKLDPTQRFSRKDAAALSKATAASNLPDDQLTEAMTQEVTEELSDDSEATEDAEGAGGSGAAGQQPRA
ncbi:hypothetical protein WNN43_09460 [Corynebacterium mastitidis]